MMQSGYMFCSPICLPLSSLWNKAHLRIQRLLKKEKEDNDTGQDKQETREPSTCEEPPSKPSEAECLANDEQPMPGGEQDTKFDVNENTTGSDTHTRP